MDGVIATFKTLLLAVLVFGNNAAIPSTTVSSISECQCNKDGSTTLECDENGDCTCKDGYAGKKCDDIGKNIFKR